MECVNINLWQPKIKLQHPNLVLNHRILISEMSIFPTQTTTYVQYQAQRSKKI